MVAKWQNGLCCNPINSREQYSLHILEKGNYDLGGAYFSSRRKTTFYDTDGRGNRSNIENGNRRVTAKTEVKNTPDELDEIYLKDESSQA